MFDLKTTLGAALLIAGSLAAPSARAHSKDIVDTAVGAGSFKTLAAALGAAELVDTLKGKGPFTVFAPTDEAFAKLPKGTVDRLLEPKNRDELTAILTYHVVSGSVSARAAVQAGEAPTVQGEGVKFRIVDGGLRVNDSKVTTNDLACSNGVIHVIDSVLIPPSLTEPKGRKLIGIYTEHVSRTLEAQLGVKRSGALVVTRVTDGGNAKKAGLKKYDVLTSINGRPASQKSIDLAKNETRVGDPIRFELIRGGHPTALSIPLGVERH